MRAQLVRTVRKSWRLGVVAALLVLFAASAIPALAISFGITVTGLEPTQLWGGYPPVRVADVALYAPDTLYGATVTITDHYVLGDTLGTTACGGLTCVYTAPTLTISGAGTAAQYTSALSAVVFSTTATGAGAGGDRTLTYSIDVAVMPGYFKCPGIENHYYYRNSGGYKRWSESRQEALLNYKYLGYTGYLVHINSAGENDCVKAQYGSHQGWIGFHGTAPTGPYNWVDGPTGDNPPGYINWGGGEPADKPSQLFVYMDPSGGTWYNVLDQDSGSKDGYVVEFGNTAEDSGQPKSGTAIVHVIEPPDLTATKTASNAATIPADSWTWTVTIANSKEGAAAFQDGDTIFQDDLPNINIGYGTPSVLNVTNVTNSGNINCAIDAFKTLTCKASGAGVTIGGTYGGQPAGQFDVQFRATASDAGTFVNPRGGGICSVDPNDVVIEWTGTTPGQNNNGCSHTVYVAILQRGKSGYNGAQDTYITPAPKLRLPLGHNPELIVRANDTAAALLSFDLTTGQNLGPTVRSAAQWVYAYERCMDEDWFKCKGDPTKASLSVREYRMLRAWNEDQATWLKATDTIKWKRAGANGINADRAGAVFATGLWNSLGWKPFDTTGLVQTWYANPATNFGTILKAFGGSRSALFRLYSSDYVGDPTLRPSLHIVSW